MTAQLDKQTTQLQLPIELPQGSEIQVKVGQEISKNEIIAIRPPDQIKYDLASGLKLKAHKVDKLLNKNIGDQVESGEILIEAKSWFRTKKIISHIDGTIVHYESGVMMVQVQANSTEIKSPFNGKIINIDEQRIIVEVSGEQINSHWGWGPMKWGELVILGNQNHHINLETVQGNYNNKIIVISGKLTKGLWHKLSALGAQGIITSQVPPEVEQWPSSNSDQEETILVHHPTMVILDNGHNKFAESVWKWFNNNAGKIAAVNGAEKSISIIL